ncbi:unnamed protein product [Parascedosporium putredinis]|uniref:DUF7053 domain-containing protein n=1 Tax=Parascedosporium putredinis TaxID=1442378 RepID=A0A9P1GU77_9PEZI|nr:unnamed protein product [Parascedosporium putredinis]CAI7987724.1 unnamed protein product [Parascedosporium putredinis]
MSKRTVFTTITPLPAGITREIAVAFLQDHLRMIDLNPLVIARHPISCPANAPPDEHHCSWYSLTDSISYLPGGKVTGQVSYTAAFNNVSRGVQTHVYAPMGLNIRETWTVGGTLPGEPSEPVELGLGAPQTGLYVREDVDMRCNVLMASFVKKTLKKAHSSLVEAVKVEAQRTADTIAAAAASPSVAHPRGVANPSPGHSWSGSAPPACSGNPLLTSRVVSKYPRAKEQDYSDIAAANPFDDSDDSSSWDSPILGHANTGHFPPTNRYSAFEPEAKSSGSSYLRRYPAQEPELDLLGAQRPRDPSYYAPQVCHGPPQGQGLLALCASVLHWLVARAARSQSSSRPHKVSSDYPSRPSAPP